MRRFPFNLWFTVSTFALFMQPTCAEIIENLESLDKSDLNASTEDHYWGIMNHFHNMNSLKGWYMDRFIQEVVPIIGDEKYENSNSISQTQDLIQQYHERKSHRHHIRKREGSIYSANGYNSKSIEKRDDVLLTDSIPIKDSINYGDAYSYTFQYNNQSEWAYGNEVLVFISASLCKLPTAWNTSTSYNGLNLYFTFNQTIATALNYPAMDSAPFQNGYAEGLAQLENFDSSFDGNHDGDDTLYLFVVPDTCSTCDAQYSWVFELGVSQNNILFRYDVAPVLSVVDTDYESAIFNTSEVELHANRTFQMFIFESSSNPLQIAMNQSWCAVTENSDFTQGLVINNSTIINGTNILPVTNLTIGTQYDAVLVVADDNVPYGGGVYQEFSFATANNKACKLLYGLEFCDEVAYAVPNSLYFANGSETWEEISQLYDDNAKSYFEPFEFSLQQVACDTELDSRYSPIRTCDNCRYSYKQWLCAVTVPRCDYSASDANQHKLYDKGKGRTDFIENTIIPPMEYSEILPCLNVCHAIARDCPSSLNFGCPSSSKFIKLSYGDTSVGDVKNEDSSKICNYLGSENYLI